MGLRKLFCLLLFAVAIKHQLIPSRSPELFTTQKTLALTSLVPTATQYWYLQTWMYVVTADADMKQLAITRQDGSVFYCRWVDSTFETDITYLLTDTYESAFALNKWIFMEMGTQSNKLYGRLLARGGGIRRLAISGTVDLDPSDTLTTPISASAFSVTSK